MSNADSSSSVHSEHTVLSDKNPLVATVNNGQLLDESTKDGVVHAPTTPTGDEIVDPAAAAASAQQTDNQQLGDDTTNGVGADGKTQAPTERVQEMVTGGANPTQEDHQPANPETLAAQLEHKLKTDRREWRRMIDECKKSMKSADGEEAAASLY